MFSGNITNIGLFWNKRVLKTINKVISNETFLKNSGGRTDKKNFHFKLSKMGRKT